MDDISISLRETEIKKALRIMLSESGRESLAALGRELGLKETTFRSSLANNSIRLKDFLNAAELMGYDVVVKKNNK